MIDVGSLCNNHIIPVLTNDGFCGAIPIIKVKCHIGALVNPRTQSS